MRFASSLAVGAIPMVAAMAFAVLSVAHPVPAVVPASSNVMASDAGSGLAAFASARQADAGAPPVAAR